MSSLNTLLFIVHELVLASAGNLLEKRDLSKVHALSELESHSKNKSPDDAARRVAGWHTDYTGLGRLVLHGRSSPSVNAPQQRVDIGS